MFEPKFKIKVDQVTKAYGKFVIEPLEEGYGHTLGNSLRRVLLTSIKGAAIVSVKIEGVKHQFSTLPGLKEDIVEFLLNVKKIRLQIADDKPVKLSLVKRGEGEIYAKDIEVPAGVEIVNPDLYLGMLSDKKSKLEVEMMAQTGFGYETADQKKSDVIGKLIVDSIYTPVKRVNYKVESTRVGRMTNLDKLILEIWTDETVNPEGVLEEAAKILVSYFLQIYEPKAEITEGVAVTPAVSDEVLKMRIEELDIPTRIVNALANGGIETVGQLLGTPKAELMKLKNLGTKSLSVVEEKLREKGVALSV
ncbi:MAG: DNA-directed RNA polymerase subunit alpha [Candidatus Gottesmanbacteria bacterium GW2011_GWB1_43_11]|uniref:DNA-directed RNA polymerase subunit alpha n=1 Tax=Candidatus Gottesmanbacteria bacterium GW2011_GWB1_43_11 TaxID=1618446 RepID=A0A0G1CMY2_9BACT|nr:MAG: DNA-directed RNA polymerase subunit alpha [Candidatus Gottesmanbacteria bacterium GW2011_GWA2_42_16]KKS55762.1 MAG: DNA-directed RNA polymerase subunit alpha [Candidatus Gottesmanbacteria bacterium GW2011_GWA1_42_26]KKS81932.1 MAG: DNA-directed RNA polymerase subunit alpha, DNA-directed RNA polymerase subunit alpha [Candidatus Gottesmanbacteria bacterium GW2011_GWC1_43_10]KKS86852.1 MAG: DNA-directed RNA polymerase subunit alpha [Candidatus Gottesmanbacteria bacterium GW2011_GWB1_43_11]